MWELFGWFIIVSLFFIWCWYWSTAMIAAEQEKDWKEENGST